jgi:ribosomal protein L1
MNLEKSIRRILREETKSKTVSETPSVDVILMGGLDYRKGDLNISQQVELLKKNSSKKNIIGHRYNQFSDVKNSIAQNPNAIIVLFSAGCSYASSIASLIKNKSKLFIVEPYAISSNTSSSVQTAVGKGVSPSNVITGPSKARGLDVVSGATKTPKGINHWGALGYVGNFI